jgi:hypothetical protein
VAKTSANDTGGNCRWCQRHRLQLATGINDSGGKFATGVIDTGSK